MAPLSQIVNVDVRLYFTMKGDLRLFEQILRTHQGGSWFEVGIQQGYGLSQIHAIAAGQEHLWVQERAS